MLRNDIGKVPRPLYLRRLLLSLVLCYLPICLHLICIIKSPQVILNVIVYHGMTFDKQKSAVGFVASGEDGSSLVKYSIKVKQDNLEPFMKALEALVPPQK